MSRISQTAHKAHDDARGLEPPAVLRELAAMADVRFNGDRPWDIRVHDAEVYHQILTRGSLGFGEAYMDGLWDCERLDVLFTRLLGNGVGYRLRGLLRLRLMVRMFANTLHNSLFNRQSRRHAFEVGERHYDIGNAVFEAMLDPTLSYSCGYWAHAESLEQAQRDKLDLICRKLALSPGDRLLDIGCGWGGLVRYAAEQYGVEALGITVSHEQQRLARERCRGLPVHVELMDYRQLQGRFDKVVSVGMFEHVGPRNYPAFFETVSRVLDDDGLFLLHTIGDVDTNRMTDPWLDKYIFPNHKLPSAREVTAAFEAGFVLQDWHNFGPDYDRTLIAWRDNFNAAWPRLRGGRYDSRFHRMWNYYLQSCAGFFRSGQGQLWQIVLSRRGRRMDYRSVR
ncbi:MAG: cyclopropane fatty acyl phospholipid synthase [Thiogranum sp.]